MCYSILYFKPSTEKNDSSVILKSLYPEGPIKRYLSRPGDTKDFKNGTSCSSAWHSALRK